MNTKFCITAHQSEITATHPMLLKGSRYAFTPRTKMHQKAKAEGRSAEACSANHKQARSAPPRFVLLLACWMTTAVLNPGKSPLLSDHPLKPGFSFHVLLLST